MRKIISVLLSVILLVTLTVPAMAATVTQEINSTAIGAGEAVTVTVSLDEAVEDVTVYQYSLYYNKALFTLTGSEGSATVSNSLSDSDGDYYMISYVDPTSNGVTVEAGVLAKLTFVAREDLTQEQAASFLLRQDYFWDTSYSDVEGISLANGTVTVTVAPAAAATYTVTLTGGAGYTIAATEGSVSPVTEGGSFSFTVTVDTQNYEGTPVVKANGNELTAAGDVYTIENITQNQTVTVEGITAREPAGGEEPAADVVIYADGTDGSEWPPTPVYVDTLTLSGLAVKEYRWEGDDCYVTLPGGTAADAAFTITCGMGVENPNYLSMFSISFNGTETESYSSSLTDGAAEIEVYAQFQNEQYSGTKTIHIATETQAVVPETYTVTLTEGEGYTIAAAEGSVSPVTEGGSFSFTVTVLEGYEGTPLVDANGGEIPLLNGVYTIEDITEDQVVTVEGITKIPVVQTYTITLTEGTGYAIAPVSGSTNPVEAGGSYSFTVTVLDGYLGDPVVKINNSTLGQTNGVYTISNVNNDYTVTVSGIRAEDEAADQVIFKKTGSDSNWPNPNFAVFLDSLTVKGLATTGYEWDSAMEVCTVTLYKTTAQDASFTLTAQVGHSANPQMMSAYSLTIDGTKYQIPNNGNISVTKVLANGEAEVVIVGTCQNVSATKTIRLVVDGSTPPAPATYAVTLPENPVGYTVTPAEGSESPVTEGGSYSFRVDVLEGYQGTPVVKANGTELTAVNDAYTIENIAADQTVTVEGITAIPNTYTVTLTEGTGYTITAAEGSESPVTEGGSFSFTVTVNNGYEGTPVVKANDSELTVSEGVYTIENIAADQTVTVEGISLKDNMYIVSASEDVTASKGENAPVSILVTGNSNSEITGYNDYDVTVSYDPSALTYVSAVTAHDTAEVTCDADAGTIRIVGHGDGKSYSENLATLTFTAKESGSHNVAITSAKIDNSGNAISKDAPEAAVSDAAAAVKVAYPVTLPDDFVGESTVLPGGDYVFTAPNDCYEITVTVDGVEVSVEPAGLVYTLRGVTGDVVITAVGKTYDVNKEGTNVTVNGADTAQYGSDYTFTLSASSGYAVTAVKVTVNGVEVDYTISGGTYTVPGSAITGELTVTVTTTQQPANTTQITFEGVDASEVVGGLVQFATNGQDFTFELNEEEGYAYTVMLGDQELEAEDGVYTIPGSMIDGSALAITISKEVYSFEPVVNVSQYIQLDGTVMWLITATDEDDNILAYGTDGAMFWSDKYDAYCWLVISDGTEDAVREAAESKIVIAEANWSPVVEYDYDVNQTDAVDINDAQLTYDMYQAKLYSDFTVVSMDRFLEADVNGDGCVNVEDAAAVVAQVIN